MHTSFSWSRPHTDITCSPSSPSPIPTVSTFPQHWSFLFYITYAICSPPHPHCPHLSPELVLSCPHHMCPVALSISSLRASFSPSHGLSDSLRRGTGWIDQQNMVLCIVYKIISTQSQEKRKVMRTERVCLWVHYVFILFSNCVCCCLGTSLSKINLAYIQLVSFLEEYSNTLNSTYFKFTYKQGQIYYQ